MSRKPSSAKSSKKPRSKSNWKITTNRFVGYVDIMGFKDMVGRNSHDSIYSMMKKVYKSLDATESTFGLDYETNEENVFITTYSDSIMIYSKDETSRSMESFIGSVANLMDELFNSGIPFKGAVALGTMTLDKRNSIFFGQPLIDAYLLSEELNFYGVVVHATAEYKEGFKDDSSVIEYSCPFKNGIAQHLTISPITFLIAEDEPEMYKDLCKAVSKLGSKTSGSIRKYIDNTLRYLEYANQKTNK